MGIAKIGWFAVSGFAFAKLNSAVPAENRSVKIKMAANVFVSSTS
jgi:hypothetical protein